MAKELIYPHGAMKKEETERSVDKASGRQHD
jgi:hypothetical protein